MVIFDYNQKIVPIIALGEDQCERRNLEGRTLYHLFKDHLENTREFYLENSIVTCCSNLKGGLHNLHLIPSSLDFIQIQDRLIHIAQTTLIHPINKFSFLSLFDISTVFAKISTVILNLSTVPSFYRPFKGNYQLSTHISPK